MNKYHLQLKEVLISYKDNNVVKGNTILFVHGNTLSSEYFTAFLQNFDLMLRHRVITLDLPGHGESERLKSYSVELFRETLEEFCLRLDLKNIVLVGHSLGGHFCLQMLEKLKEIKSVVTASMAPARKPPNLMDMFAPHPVNAFLFNQEFNNEQIAQFAKILEMKNSDFMQYYNATDVNVRPSIAESIASGNYLDELDLMRRSKIPVIMLIGERDPLINQNYLKSITNEVSNCCLVVIRDTGHNIFGHSQNNESIKNLLNKPW